MGDIAYGLRAPSYYDSISPFINIAKSSTALEGVRYSDGGRKTLVQMQADGDSTADGYPIRIPSGYDYLSCYVTLSPATAYNNGAIRAYLSGRYVITYDGIATMAPVLLGAGGSLTIVSSVSGRIVFDVTFGDNQFLLLNIYATNAGTPATNIVWMKAAHEALYNAGKRFNPDWLNLLRNAKTLRFMDWFNTNGATIVNWADRARRTHYSYGQTAHGAPLEVAVDLCNELGCDGWFNLPHTGSNDYYDQFATYVKANLNTTLCAYWEWSNEIWNFGFSVWAFLAKYGEPYLNNNPATPNPNWWWTSGSNGYTLGGYFASRALARVKTIYTGEPAARSKLILAIQTGYLAQNDYALQCSLWNTNYAAGVRTSPDGLYTLTPYVQPSTVATAMAKTCYFGGSEINDAPAGSRAELISRIQGDSFANTAAWVRDRNLDVSIQFSVPYQAATFIAAKAKADSYGLYLLNYEGGSHMAHSAGTTMTAPQIAVIMPFFIEFSKSEYIATLQNAMWNLVENQSEGPFMQFQEAGYASNYGVFGCVEVPNQLTSRQAVNASRSRGLPYVPGYTGVTTKVA